MPSFRQKASSVHPMERPIAESRIDGAVLGGVGTAVGVGVMDHGVLGFPALEEVEAGPDLILSSAAMSMRDLGAICQASSDISRLPALSAPGRLTAPCAPISVSRNEIRT